MITLTCSSWKRKTEGYTDSSGDPTVAITTTLYTSSAPILEIISFIRTYNDRCKIVVGGPFIYSQIKFDWRTQKRLFQYIGADFYVISHEGEQTLANLIQALKANASMDQVDNLVYQCEGTMF